jgi:hypothetical protein
VQKKHSQAFIDNNEIFYPFRFHLISRLRCAAPNNHIYISLYKYWR